LFVAAFDDRRALRQARADHLRPLLQEDERRVQTWFQRKSEEFDERRERYRTAGGTVRSDQHKRLEADLSEATKRMDKRLEWIKNGLATVDEPYLKVAAVFVGEG
jgi:hypothetical protein